MHSAQKLINHVALVLDASSSMGPHEKKLVEIADKLIRDLALISEEKNQETRVSIYKFADNVTPLIFDMDVMRLPSIADLYTIYGMTALFDATIKSQVDLTTTSQIYGDHAFLTFVLTDGEENKSRNTRYEFSNLINNANENWTLAFLVPNSTSQAVLERFGAPSGNISVWDTRSTSGIVDAGHSIRQATETFMTNRASGIRGSRNVFSTGVDAVNDQTVRGNLTPLRQDQYVLVPVHYNASIREFIEGAGYHYTPGIGYYQLNKTEEIQGQKDIIIVDKNSGQAYSGPEARSILGLPNMHTKVKPTANPLYDIYVQSTSVNRKLIPGTRVLVKR
jgi:hypothetical protein